jgi:hypothetical protein
VIAEWARERIGRRHVVGAERDRGIAARTRERAGRQVPRARDEVVRPRSREPRHGLWANGLRAVEVALE